MGCGAARVQVCALKKRQTFSSSFQALRADSQTSLSVFQVVCCFASLNLIHSKDYHFHSHHRASIDCSFVQHFGRRQLWVPPTFRRPPPTTTTTALKTIDEINFASLWPANRKSKVKFLQTHTHVGGCNLFFSNSEGKT